MQAKSANRMSQAMHTHSLDEHRHSHDFRGADHARNERRSWLVIALCAAMMVAEIGGGLLFKSMALIADGLHMSTHAVAFLIAAFAYSLARRHKHDERFGFGTGKFGDLAAFSSAIILAVDRVVDRHRERRAADEHPVPIAFREAIPIAILGLIVNLISAALLHDDHAHEHEHSHAHEHEHYDAHSHHHHRDLNLRAAYVHVLAEDLAVSLLAILGLSAGLFFGLVWMDALMGLIGTAVIASWSLGLMRSAGAVLLDLRVDPKLAASIRERLEVGDDLVCDLHLWRVGPGPCRRHRLGRHLQSAAARRL